MDQNQSVTRRIRQMCRNTNILYYELKYSDEGYPNGVDILSEDWDNMLLLDACRYDMFESRVDLPGELSKKYSKGTMTAQFLESNFDSQNALDTVYVTANPMMRRIEADNTFNFHDIIDVWELDGWDDEVGTVRPDTMTEFVKRAAEQYPNKRILAHFLQPHFPFINSDTEFDKQIPDPSESGDIQFWNQLRTEKLSIDRSELWEAYCSNLDIVVPQLKELLETLPGKTIVTSDHGNIVGERSRPIPIKDWGHPRSLYVPELLEIPWLEYHTGSRKTVFSEESESSQENQVADSEVIDRLKQLGYK